MFKTKNTGRALSISAVIICVCFAMLLGTTFAWFTDTAMTKVNTISTAKFDIDIREVDAVGTITTTSLVGDTLAFVYKDNNGGEHEFAADALLWEPGMTVRTQTFAIVNEGAYALDFKIDDIFANATTTDNKANSNVDLTDAISYKVYTLVNGNFVEYQYAADVNGKNVGEEVFLYPKNSTVGESARVFYIEFVMDSLAGNEYQECELEGLAVSVSASQAMYENDYNGTVYDSDAIFDPFETVAP